MQDKKIPLIKILKWIPTSTLIQEGNVYDFHGWYCSLVIRKSVFAHAKDECIEMERSIQEIQSKILTSIEELLGQDVHTSSSLNVKGLKEKMKFVYFKELESIWKNQLNDLVSLTIHISNLQKLNACSYALDVIKLQLDGLPSVTMEELNSVMSRFVEYAAREKNEGIF